jgi:hypothetical protein
LFLFASSPAAALARRRGRDVLFIYVPVVLALLLLPPSDGAWRAHIVGPLVCAGAAMFATRARPWLLIPALCVAAVLAIYPFLPARPGNVGLADLLRATGAPAQPHGFYDPLKGHPLVVYGTTDFELARRVWLRPGAYELGLDASAQLIASIDGEPIFTGMNGDSQFEVHGHLHELRLRFLTPGVLEGLWMRPAGNE